MLALTDVLRKIAILIAFAVSATFNSRTVVVASVDYSFSSTCFRLVVSASIVPVLKSPLTALISLAVPSASFTRCCASIAGICLTASLTAPVFNAGFGLDSFVYRIGAVCPIMMRPTHINVMRSIFPSNVDHRTSISSAKADVTTTIATKIFESDRAIA